MPSLLWSKPGAVQPLFTPRHRYNEQPIRHLVVLDHGRTPTLDYYVRPRLAASGHPAATIVDIATTPPRALAEGTFVIIVRYLNDTWAKHLRTQSDRLAGAAFLMDDDLPAAWRSPQLPWRYRYKIFRLFHRQRQALGDVCDRIWVSTPHLAHKYAHPGIVLLPPLPPARDVPDSPAGVTYFYHGSASHGPEFAWLRQVVARVQNATSRLTFITLGDARVRRIYAGLPRVIVLHPLPWATYRESMATIRHDIGLVPLLDNEFNRSRSHSKFFDVTDLGAVGLYANTPPYSEFVRDGDDGLLLDDDPDAWSRAIVKLAHHPEERAAMVRRARDRIAHMVADALPMQC